MKGGGEDRLAKRKADDNIEEVEGEGAEGAETGRN